MSGHRIWLFSLLVQNTHVCACTYRDTHMYMHMHTHESTHTYSMRRESDEGNVYVQATQVGTESVLTSVQMQSEISINESGAAKTATAEQMR